MIGRLLRRLRMQRAQMALETILVFPAWFLTVTLFFNMIFYMGSMMIAQAELDRVANETAAFGCMATPIQSSGLMSGLGIQNMQVNAMSADPSNPQNLNYDPSTGAFRPFDWTQYVDQSTGLMLAPQPGVTKSANCLGNTSSRQLSPGVEPVASGQYIFLQMTYKQSLWLFGSINVTRNALVSSQRLEGEH